MSIIVELLTKFIQFLKAQFMKIILLLIFTVVFIFILFPFGDMGDLVSTQVSRGSGNQVNLNFDQMGIDIFPAPGVEFKQVIIELQNLSPISAKQLIISPSLSGAISQKPYGRIIAKGILKGNLDLNVSGGKKSEKGTERQKIEIDISDLSLQELRQATNLPVMIKGQLNLSSKALADLTLTEQPEINDLNLNIKNFELLPATINLGQFPLSIPGFKVSQLEMKGHLTEGRFIIESGRIGQDNDEISGSLTGSMNLNFQNFGGNPVPQFGPYEFLLDLKVKKRFQDKAALFLLFIDNFKRQLPDGFQYKVKLSGAYFGPPPRTSPLQ